MATTACWMCATGDCAQQRITCPELLQPESMQPQRPPAGWDIYMPHALSLTEGGMLHGAPNESAYLVPDNYTSRKVGKQTIQTQSWTFDVPHGYTTWAYCGYGGAGGPLQLFKRIADDATQCILTTKSIDQRTKQMAEFICK
ncbi:MAG: STY0301 family protein [Pseudomonadota bacterium]